MQKDLSQNRIQRKSFIKLIALSAILAVIVQFIYETSSVDRNYGDDSLNKKISINFNDLPLYTLSEYIICFLATFGFLFGMRFLYYYFARQKRIDKFL